MNMMISRILCFVLSIVSLNPTHAQMSKAPVDYVDPLMGGHDSRWMMFPGPAMPFGMVKLSPDNERTGWKAGYEYTIDNITGFSHIHSWTMDGLLTFPTTGPLKTDPGFEQNPDAGYRSRIDKKTETASVGYYKVDLLDYGVVAELTATTRCGFQRYTFNNTDSARILVDLQIESEYGSEIFNAQITRMSASEIEGYSIQQALRGARFNDYTVHFVIRFDRPFKTFNGWTRDGIKRNVDVIFSGWDHTDVGAFLEFDLEPGDQVLMQSAISLVSIEQARLNLQKELIEPFGWDFEAVRKYNSDTWNKLLSLIEVEGNSEINKKKFYTNMYRAYVGRTIWNDVNGKYMDMYEKVQQLEDPESPIYGGDAFWNTFWNLNQLWTLVTPDIANQWVKSLLEIYRVGGWLPKGPTGIEYSSIMVASHQVALIVAAYQKGIRNYDIEKAYESIRHVQTTPPQAHLGGGQVGNRQLVEYLKWGYVPYESGPASNTLEYAYDDWCVSQMAKALGKMEDYYYFRKRAHSYLNIWDPSVGFMNFKGMDGKFLPDFDPFCCSTFLDSGWCEGNAWQYSWFVPHDLKTLIALMGKDEFNRRLQEGFENSREWKFNSEFTDENSLHAMGVLPINHGNQPNMQAAYLFNYSGKPWLTQYWARAILNEYYGATPMDAWPGDEDQGQMGAWFVMSAMGLFEMNGGTATEPWYEIGSPIFDKVKIHLDQNYYPGQSFEIIAINNSDENVFIQKATLNGKPLDKPWFYHKDLIKGGNLILEMGPSPNENWGSLPEQSPPSMSDGL
ncbi:MAG TPA: GH92 family glycosyl hydrolase [Saprospiraceae bacterium]|mgnify:CR=1 FL=1|nr:GH92 family glycosyl hydrolase [Saprospiraceae bacterium]